MNILTKPELSQSSLKSRVIASARSSSDRSMCGLKWKGTLTRASSFPSRCKPRSASRVKRLPSMLTMVVMPWRAQYCRPRWNLARSMAISASVGQGEGSPPVAMPRFIRASPPMAMTGAKASNSRSSPVARPSAPITTSCPWGVSAPLRMPACFSAAVLAQTVWWSCDVIAMGRSAMIASRSWRESAWSRIA